MTRQWDETVDVVVVGSGGAALTAALAASERGASVIVLEKDDVIGGTTGVSGGVLWVPDNRHVRAAGHDDSRDDALAYLSHIGDGQAANPDLVEVFLDRVNEMLDFVERSTPLETQMVPSLPDYYGPILERIPGCKPFSRSIEPKPYPARDELGDEADRIAARSTLLSLGASTTLVEDRLGPDGVDREELARRERDGVRVKGAALVACLMKGLIDREVEVRTESPVDELLLDDDRAVVGVVAAGRRVGARRGVILACGGFEWNADMARTYLGYEVKPISPGTNTGDGHRIAMEAGARMGNMTQYWGQGAMLDPAIVDRHGAPAPQMSVGLGPGSILVNGAGERFMHGGFTYNDFPKVFGQFDQRRPGFPNLPHGWVVFGPSVKNGRDILTMKAGEPAPDWLVQAPTVEELASRIGVDAATLARTIETYNGYVDAGVDPEWGDPSQTHVMTGYNNTLGRVEGPPYYAIEQWPATLGTCGGCRVDADGQVLGYRSARVEGLYAAGNTSATVLGGAYVGGGTPIASGMTFGYLAGCHSAGRPGRDIG